jgi:poly-D-alanine transfer protein DltD
MTTTARSKNHVLYYSILAAIVVFILLFIPKSIAQATITENIEPSTETNSNLDSNDNLNKSSIQIQKKREARRNLRIYNEAGSDASDREQNSPNSENTPSYSR